MSLDNQRNLALALSRDPVFLKVAGEVAAEMNAWSRATLGRRDRRRPDRPARLHGAALPRPRAAPRRPARALGRRLGLLRLDRRRRHLRGQQSRQPGGAAGSPVVLYLPKIQTAEEAALWHDLLSAARAPHSASPMGTIKVYVLVEQLEACYQLMEIRAALGPPLRRLQHRPLGLHQQRVGRAGLGPGIP